MLPPYLEPPQHPVKYYDTTALKPQETMWHSPMGPSGTQRIRTS